MRNTIQIICDNNRKILYNNLPTGTINIKNKIKVIFKGNSGKLIIHESTDFRNTVIRIGTNSLVYIKKTIHTICDLSVFAVGQNVSVLIKDNFSCWGCTIRMYDIGTSLIIGYDCMFSLGIYIWGTDGHTIFDVKNKKSINSKKNIKIGNHVWIGYGVTLLKGTQISDNSVVGAKSLLCSNFEMKNVIIAGHPAKIIRQEINWSRKSIDEYNQDMNIG